MSAHRRQTYVALWMFAVAFGWVEGAAVIYLRATAATTSTAGVLFPLTLISPHFIWVEIVREACTIVMLGSVAWAAARRWRDGVGAFLLMFGIWDLVYYAVLWLVTGWPGALTNWDVLFLIPLPWVAPVWAPATVAAIFAGSGTYLFWTGDVPHRYIVGDVVLLMTSALMVVAAFLVEWRIVFTLEPPQDFAAWLFWAGVAFGVGWFIHAERRRLAHA